jgi:hypothetical protein
MKRMTAALALAASLAFGGAARAQLAARQPIDLGGLTMEDQFEQRQSVAAHRGDVLVLIYGDRKSADANRYLGEQLHIAFHPAARGQAPAQARLAPVLPVQGAPAGKRSPDVRLVAAASLGTVPSLLHGMIRAQFRGGSPDVPVWLDWQDALKKQFGLTPGAPNVVIVDAQGRLRYTFASEVSQEAFNQMMQAIEGLRREAVQ